MSKKNNILILGGSYAGISVAHNTHKHIIPRLPDSSTYKIIIVSASSQIIADLHAPAPSYPALSSTKKSYSSAYPSSSSSTEPDFASSTVPQLSSVTSIEPYLLMSPAPSSK
jgi:NADH dehydrogenase FAD-containing subunit